MPVSRIFRLLTIAGYGSAFVIRDDPQLNSTTDLPVATPIGASVVSLLVTSSNSRPTWRPKVHGESTADGFEDTSTTQGDSRIHVEATATGFVDVMPTASNGRGSEDSITMIDIGTVIQSIITSWTAMPTVHLENSAPGWETYSSAIVHFEKSASDWEVTDRQNPSTPQTSRYTPVEVSDDPWTKGLQTPQTTVPARPNVEQPQVTTVPSKTITEFPPPPVVTHNGVTIRPVAVTLKPTVVLPGGKQTTTEEVIFQVAVGSSTLSVGTPVTVNNIVIGVTVDSAGSTVLHAGDLTTILPKPVAGEVRTVAVNEPEPIKIVTAVIDKTTKYILAGQTLAPGQPITIGNTSVSISTSSGYTVLYVGDTTTTLSAAGPDTQTITDWTGVNVATLGTVANSSPFAANPTSTRSGASALQKPNTALTFFALGTALIIYVT